jgi:Uma2 family endonuclease
MNWQEVCEHPDLQNLPFKIELNANGQILMSPVKVLHSLYQGKIEHFLRSLLPLGETLPECAIKTSQGTKVADVAWVSTERLAIIKYETECSIAPEICIEVDSQSNTDRDMTEKRILYFEQGAQEVWICDQNGQMSFYNSQGPLTQSKLVAGFPAKIEI